MSELDESILAMLDVELVKPSVPLVYYIPTSQVDAHVSMGAELVEFVQCENDGEEWLVAKMRGAGK